MLLLGLIIIFSSHYARSQSEKAPNIIIILADDMGWGDVGYHGSEIKTPNIDRLVKEGIQLNRYYTAAVCSPTRAGLMTGRYPDRYDLRNVVRPWSDFGVDTTETFLPQFLAEVGYTNRAMIGKWHLGHANAKYHPLKRGFTHFYGHFNGAIDYFTHEREGELDWHNDYKPSYDTGYSTDLLADETIKCIKSYDKKSPFFIYLAFNAAHIPLQAKKEDLLMYGYTEDKPSGKRKKKLPQGSGNTDRQTFSAIVSNMDANIGRILTTLKEQGIDQNTLILFHSDNGGNTHAGASSGELRGKKATEWEGGVRAPSVIKWPDRFKGGEISNQVMGYIDIVPTLLDIAGNKKTPKKQFDGISMLPVLEGKVKNIDRNMYLGFGAIVNQNYKLIEADTTRTNATSKEDVLFKISVDASEERNVKSENLRIYNALKNEIKKYQSIQPSVKAPLPGNNPPSDFVPPKEWTFDYK